MTDSEGNTLDTSGYTTAVMTFYSQDRQTTLKTITSTAIPTNGTMRWIMLAADTAITLETGRTRRIMAAQIVLTGSSSQRGTFDFTAYCYS